MQYAYLIEKAIEAMSHAYAPYSKFYVGAALRTKSGKVYTGCNVENVSFGGSICAERVALVKAVSEGEREFEAIAIVNSSPDVVFPCGFCRQLLAEFGTDLIVVVAGKSEVKQHLLADLLPHAFDNFQSGE